MTDLSKFSKILKSFFDSPLVLGLSYLIPVLLLLTIGLLTIKGWFVNDFQHQALILSTSPTSTATQKHFIVYAAQNYDYTLAEKEIARLQKNHSESVLGASTDWDTLLYPDQTLKTIRTNLEEQSKQFVSRQLYLQLAIANWRLFDQESAEKYLNFARSLDPNDQTIKVVSQLLKLN